MIHLFRMRRKNKLTCFFITVSLTLLNVMSSDVYASSNPSCSIRVLASLLFPNLSASLHPELADYISLQPPDLDKKILRQAFLRASRIQAPPVRQSGEYNFEEAARPTSFQSEITVGSKESPILAKKVGNRSMVFEIQTVEGKRFIRPLGRFGSRYGGGPRLTVAASRLNLLMQLGSVPQARFAQTFLKIRPESEYPSGLLTDLAAVSEEVVSQSGKDDIDRHEFGHYPAEYINAHPYPEKSWDALAFEFLIGNRDVNGSKREIHVSGNESDRSW